MSLCKDGDTYQNRGGGSPALLNVVGEALGFQKVSHVARCYVHRCTCEIIRRTVREEKIKMHASLARANVLAPTWVTQPRNILEHMGKEALRQSDVRKPNVMNAPPGVELSRYDAFYARLCGRRQCSEEHLIRVPHLLLPRSLRPSV